MKGLNVDSEKIKYDWGSIKRFCRENNINHNTYRVVKAGNGTSSRIISILESYGYIKNGKKSRKNSK